MFYSHRELLVECIFSKFPKYTTILLGDVTAKDGKEDIFKPTFGMRICPKLIIIMELGQ
jgi:hypothetical protein